MYPFVFYCAIYLLINLYMTKKRHFTFKDKLYFCLGGTFILVIGGLIYDMLLLGLLGIAFFINYLVLISPSLKKFYYWGNNGWKVLFSMLSRSKKK